MDMRVCGVSCMYAYGANVHAKPCAKTSAGMRFAGHRQHCGICTDSPPSLSTPPHHVRCLPSDKPAVGGSVMVCRLLRRRHPHVFTLLSPSFTHHTRTPHPVIANPAPSLLPIGKSPIAYRGTRNTATVSAYVTSTQLLERSTMRCVAWARA